MFGITSIENDIILKYSNLGKNITAYIAITCVEVLGRQACYGCPINLAFVTQMYNFQYKQGEGVTDGENPHNAYGLTRDFCLVRKITHGIL